MKNVLDYSVGFGGKFGVQKDRVDKSALGWDHHEKVEKHSSQINVSKGSGGKFGIETDRKDISANQWKEKEVEKPKEKLEIVKGDAKKLCSKFENLAKQGEIQMKEKIELEKQKRLEQEKIEKELNKDRVIFENENSGIENEPEEDNDEYDDSFKNDSLDKDFNDNPNKSKHLNKIGISVLPMPKIENTNEVSAVNKTEQSTESNQSQDQINNDDVIIEDKKEDAMKVHIDTKTENIDLGLTATALYDYEAAESDEITFDPEELITNIEMIDEGWWRGQCRGKVGLFPANYVKLNQ